MPNYFVVRPEELGALNFLPADHVRPIHTDWINRGTNQVLKKQTVDMLMRTLFADVLSKSAVTLHRSAGLRLTFQSEADRLRFAAAMTEARQRERSEYQDRLTMLFVDRTGAARAAEQIIECGVPTAAVSMMWRASQFMDTDHKWIEGHSLLSIAGVTAGGSLTGVTLGLALFAIPGIGQIAAVGGLAAAAVNATPVISGILGATAAAMARMVSDPDVDDVALKRYVRGADKAHVFLSVDLRQARHLEMQVRDIMKLRGGRSIARS